jgi:hypothetical protein
LESSDREVLSDLINSAKEKYLEHGTSRVAVHLTTNVLCALFGPLWKLTVIFGMVPGPKLSQNRAGRCRLWFCLEAPKK